MENENLKEMEWKYEEKRRERLWGRRKVKEVGEGGSGVGAAAAWSEIKEGEKEKVILKLVKLIF